MSPKSGISGISSPLAFSSGIASISSNTADILALYDDDPVAGIGGDGGVIAISNGAVTAYGGISGTISSLPDEYTYWTNTEPHESPAGKGTTVPPGAPFVNDAAYKYVKIKLACPKEMYDTINDILYNVIELSGRCWCAENLRAVKYQDGTDIPFAKPYQNLVQNEIDFGLLYTYESLTSYPTPLTSICPAGWRIPTSDEWALLNMYDATELNNNDFWLKPNNYTNSTDFDVRGAGFYNSVTDRFEDLYRNTVFWSSDDAVNHVVTNAIFKYHCNQIEIVEIKKTDAVSVRCIQN